MLIFTLRGRPGYLHRHTGHSIDYFKAIIIDSDQVVEKDIPVVPVATSLLTQWKGIDKGTPRRNRASGNEGRSLHERILSIKENTIKVLENALC
jgi:hypothetical protein